MKLTPILLIVYVPVSAVVLILTALGYTPNVLIVMTYAFLCIIIIIEVIQIYIKERLKRSLGKKILKINNYPMAVGGFCFFIAFFIEIYISSMHYMDFFRRLELLSWSGAIVIYFLYTFVFSGRLILDSGIFCDGKALKWDEILGYKWKNGLEIINRSRSHKIVFKIEEKPDLKMTVYDNQIGVFTNVIQEKGCNFTAGHMPVRSNLCLF